MALGQDCTGHEVAAQMVQIFIEHSILNQPNPEVHQKRIDMMSQQVSLIPSEKIDHNFYSFRN